MITIKLFRLGKTLDCFDSYGHVPHKAYSLNTAAAVADTWSTMGFQSVILNDHSTTGLGH
jgi:hypothetical protein